MEKLSLTPDRYFYSSTGKSGREFDSEYFNKCMVKKR